jgi:hypothetical protein
MFKNLVLVQEATDIFQSLENEYTNLLLKYLFIITSKLNH